MPLFFVFGEEERSGALPFIMEGPSGAVSSGQSGAMSSGQSGAVSSGVDFLRRLLRAYWETVWTAASVIRCKFLYTFFPAVRNVGWLAHHPSGLLA